METKRNSLEPQLTVLSLSNLCHSVYRPQTDRYLQFIGHKLTDACSFQSELLFILMFLISRE